MLLRSPLRSVLRSPFGWVEPASWSPLDLFADGTDGTLWEPWDISTLFQDQAGTTPVTAGGDPVRRVLDKSGNSVTLSQSVLANSFTAVRMPLTGRRNLLTWTEDLTNAAWTKTQVTVVSGIEAPDGSLSAYKVEAVGYAPDIRHDITAGSARLTASLYLKKGSGANHTNTLQIRNQTTGTNILAVRINLDTGELTYLVGSTGAVAENIGNGWWRLVITTDVVPGNIYRYGILGGYVEQLGNYSYIWHPQVENGSIASNYQRVTNANDVREDGVPDVWGIVSDYAGDVLSATLPFAINGEILIAGTGGTIIEPVSYASGSTFNLGPTSYTGGAANILQSIGTVIGVVLLDREFTSAEAAQLLSYYQEKGAGGLL